MKKILFNAFGILIVLGSILGTVAYMLLKETVSDNADVPVNTSTNFPTFTERPADQTAEDGTNPIIASAYMTTRPSVPTALQGTIIVGDYAIQNWSDHTGGGEALMHYAEGEGWKIMPVASGGAWSVDALVEVGVPRKSAEGLITGRDW